MEGIYLNFLFFDIIVNWIGLMIMLKMFFVWGVGGVGDLFKFCGILVFNRCFIDLKYFVIKKLNI